MEVPKWVLEEAKRMIVTNNHFFDPTKDIQRIEKEIRELLVKRRELKKDYIDREIEIKKIKEWLAVVTPSSHQ